MSVIVPIFKRLLIGALILGVVGAGIVLFLVGSPAFAAVEPATAVKSVSTLVVGTQAAPAQSSQDRVSRLEKRYQNELTALNHVGNRLSKAQAWMVRIQSLLDHLQGQGKSPSALQTALDNFKAGLPASQAAYQSAKQVLTAHAGFDANDKVTEVASASQTVQAAARELRSARWTALSALRDLIHQARLFHSSGTAQP